MNTDSNVTITATGSMKDSEVYVKVISTQTEAMSYSTGSAYASSTSVPTVDISTGLITGEPLSFKVENATTGALIAETALPSGLGLPFPIVFGTSTYLNVSSSLNNLLEVPFALNNDYVTHGAVVSTYATQFANEGLGTITYEDNSAEFKINLHYVNTTDAVEANFLASWRKSDGALQSLHFDLKENNVNAFTPIDISLKSEYNEMVKVEVGDRFTLDLTQADFTFSATGFNPADDPTTEVGDVKNELNSLVGNNYLDIEVKEIHGMYYRVEGTVLNGTDNTRVPITDAGEEAWMVGFGRFGSILPGGNNQNTATFANGGLQLNVFSHDDVRSQAVPGFVVSEDNRIYEAWDKTNTFLVGVGLDFISETIDNLGANGPEELLFLGSKTTNTPIYNMVYTGGNTTDGGYSTLLTGNVDFKVELNETYWDEYYFDVYDEFGNYMYSEYRTVEGYQHYEFGVVADASLETTYTKDGDFDGVKFTGNAEITFKQIERAWYNWTGWSLADFDNGSYVYDGVEGPYTVSFTNIVFELNGTMTRVNPIVDPINTGTTTGNNSSSEAAPGLDLPGFELAYAFLAVSFITLVIRRRKY